MEFNFCLWRKWGEQTKKNDLEVRKCQTDLLPEFEYEVEIDQCGEKMK